MGDKAVICVPKVGTKGVATTLLGEAGLGGLWLSSEKPSLIDPGQY